MLEFSRVCRWVGALIVPAAFAACAASQSTVLPTPPQSAQRQTHARSWMTRSASSQDLLYVANVDDVTVYSYPQGKLVGTLSDFNRPYGACADAKGNVYISDSTRETIYEYAHGGTKAIKTLKDPQYSPQGCAIDPTTGNLALANYETAWDYPGNFSIYRKAKRSARPYIVEDFYYYYFTGFDDKGDAFVDGQFGQYGEGISFAELAKKSNTLTQIILPPGPGSPGGIEWDGKYVAIGDLYAGKIYQFSIANDEATLEGTTTLTGASQVGQFAVEGSAVVVPTGDSVQFFAYPAGGSATQTITDGIDYPSAVAISHAASS